MKQLYILFLITISILSSCGNKVGNEENIAEDVCQALSNYSEEDSRSFLEAATNLERVNLKYENSNPLHSTQLILIMEKKCPEGYKKYVKMVDDN